MQRYSHLACFVRFDSFRFVSCSHLPHPACVAFDCLPRYCAPVTAEAAYACAAEGKAAAAAATQTAKGHTQRGMNWLLLVQFACADTHRE